jgi:hypothetical protein
MPVGDCQAAYGAAAMSDGIRVRKGTLSLITDAGHQGLPHEAAPVITTLKTIFDRLNGDENGLIGGAHRMLQLDWLIDESKLVVEIDESQHFTTERLVTLRSYPADAEVAFSVSEYITLCEILRAGSDLYRAEKPARGFQRPGGRRAQRAYFDAVRDLVAPLSGWRVFRVPAGHNDGALAYRETRTRLRSVL